MKPTPPANNENPEVLATEIFLSFLGLGLPDGLNKTKGHHWGATTKARKQWRELACHIAREANLRITPDCRALLHWEIFCGDWRPRDEDNLRGAMKPVQDGLVDAGVIRGDSVWDIETKYTFHPRGTLGFSIAITELPELPDKPKRR